MACCCREVDLDVTGLSGIEDIVGEIIAKGDIDPESVGLTEQQADALIHRARQDTLLLDCGRGLCWLSPQCVIHL